MKTGGSPQERERLLSPECEPEPARSAATNGTRNGFPDEKIQGSKFHTPADSTRSLRYTRGTEEQVLLAQGI